MKNSTSEFRARFSSKGQIVIPSSIRRSLEIEEGTEAVISCTGNEIRLRPVTRAVLRRLRGAAKRAKVGKKDVDADKSDG